LLLSFFRVLRAARLQLCAPVLRHWSPVINSVAVSRARTVDAWEVRGHTNTKPHALHSTDVTRDVQPVTRLLVIGCWFLLDETFAVFLTNGNTVADRCSTVLLYDRDVRWSVFHQLTEHATALSLVIPLHYEIVPRPTSCHLSNIC